MLRVNIHVYPSFFTNESRILREATAIIDLGFSDQVILVGLWKEGLPRREKISQKIHLIRVSGLFRKRSNSSWENLIVFVFLFFQLAKIAFKNRPFAINAHALTMLPFCVPIARLVRSKLIYDAHELETETYASRGLRKRLAKFVERICVRFVDWTVVVSHSIEEWYRKEYGLSNITTIKNIPVFQDKMRDSDLKQKLGLSNDTILYVYVGLLSGGRGIGQIIQCFAKPENSQNHVVFIGYGDLMDEVKRSLKSNIHFLPAVSPAELPALVAGADIGLSLIEPSCLSYYCSLPNKTFEYLSAGLPFICSDLPDVRKEFDEYDICWFSNPDCLDKLIREMTREELKRKKKSVIMHRQKWDWNVEKLKLADVYQSITTSTL